MTSTPPEQGDDETWREIVANFGPEPEVDDEPKPAVPESLTPFQEASFRPYAGSILDEDDDEYIPDLTADEHPPVPPARKAAWVAALGAPAALIVVIVLTTGTGLWIPRWVPALLAVAFLAGFGYLVATMPHRPEDPFDDGARL